MPGRWASGWHAVRVAGGPVSFLEVGEGPVVVFLHGWGLSYESYRPGLARLAGLGRRVLAPALPGFGGTHDLPDESFSLAGYASWVAEFLDAVGIDAPVTLVGHSFGGGVAIKTAHDHPELVSHLVLINSVGGSAWTRGSVLKSWTTRPPWDWGLHLGVDLLPHRQLSRVLPVLVDGLVPNVVRNPRAVWRVAGLARKATLTTELEELRRRNLPVVVLWGESDQLIPPAALAALRSVLGEAALTTVHGDHNWLLSDPGAFCEVMTNVIGLGLTPAEAAGDGSAQVS